MPLGSRKLVQLLRVQGVDGIPLLVEGQTIHEGQLFHLLQRVAAVEVAAHIEFRARDPGIVEVLPFSALGQHLEDVVDRGVTDEDAAIGLLDLAEIVNRFTRGIYLATRRRGRWNVGKIFDPRQGRSADRGFLTRSIERGSGRINLSRIRQIRLRVGDWSRFRNLRNGGSRCLLPVSKGNAQQQGWEQQFVQFHRDGLVRDW